MADPLLIGIDLGTTNGKVTCYDPRGGVQAEAVHGYPTYYPAPGQYEQHPSDWLSVLESGLAEVAGALGSRARQVAALSVSNFGPGLVIVDDKGQPLAPCPTWQDDRCRSQGQRLIDEVGLDWIGLGAPLTGFPARVLWAVEEQPHLTQQADKLLDIKGFLMLWLTGLTVTDPSSGPGLTGWYEPAFALADWPVSRLSRVVAPTEVAGSLQASVAQRAGLPSGIPVYAGINDGASTTLGSGVVRLGQSIITLATNGVCRVVIDQKLPPKTIIKRHLFSWPYIDHLWICGGFTYSGASSLQWLADQFGLSRETEAYDSLLGEAARVPVGSSGVTFLPYLAGRGSPDADPDLRGGFFNLSLAHGRGELTRAALEGTTYALAEIYQEFDALSIEVDSIFVSGGGARSALWRQIIADVLDCPLTYTGGGSTLGSAVIAAVGLDIYPDIATATQAMVDVHAQHVPALDRAARYRQLFVTFKRLRDAWQAIRTEETAVE